MKQQEAVEKLMPMKTVIGQPVYGRASDNMFFVFTTALFERGLISYELCYIMQLDMVYYGYQWIDAKPPANDFGG